MFLNRRARRKFSVSTSRVYLSGKATPFQKLKRFFRSYEKRPVYRTSGFSLIAL